MAEALDCAYSVEGSGPPLILVHGIGAARNTWAKLLPVLTPHFTVVTYDLRGHGASPMPDGAFGLDELVADLERVRVRTGFDQVHIAGHSLGGMIGPAYARAFPDRVLSLGLLSTAAFRTEDDSAKVLGVVRAMEEKGIPNILPTLTDRWFTDEFIAQHGDVVERRLKQVIGTDKDVFLNVFRIYATVEMSPWLHEVMAPSLVLTGENDG
ncbi:MAG: alpha/beta fold hydrolase, partial [Roseovarius sp.]